MTDDGFEKLDAEFQRGLQSRHKTPLNMRLRPASCRACDPPDPEFYMLKRDLWLQAVPSGRGCLCLDCRSKRLKRPVTDDDFADLPFNALTGEPVAIEASAWLGSKKKRRGVRKGCNGL
jgi:hypothetical protein